MTTTRSTKPKRYEYHVTYFAPYKSWVCRAGGAIVDEGLDREMLLARLASLLNCAWMDYDQRSELIVHRKDGTIGKGPSSRRSYGGDNPKVRG